jgi:putative ABC transport system substrate-binding protein
MNSRRRLLGVMVLGLFAPRTREAIAQPRGRPARVAYLSTVTASVGTPLVVVLKKGMAERGYVEGQTVEYVVAFADGQYERLDALAAELIAQEPDVLVGAPPPVIRAYQRLTKTIPIVMANTSDAVGNGLVASLARPGGNTTGITTMYETVLPKIVEYLTELAPRPRRIGVLLNEGTLSHNVFWASAESAIKAIGRMPVRVALNRIEDLQKAFDQIQGERVEAIVVTADGMFLAHRDRIVDRVRRAGLPAGFVVREMAAAGGLFSYGPSLSDNFRHAASFIDRILKGARPGDLPVEQPTIFELVVNARTAKALGLTIPPSVLARADEVIE